MILGTFVAAGIFIQEFGTARHMIFLRDLWRRRTRRTGTSKHLLPNRCFHRPLQLEALEERALLSVAASGPPGIDNNLNAIAALVSNQAAQSPFIVSTLQQQAAFTAVDTTQAASQLTTQEIVTAQTTAQLPQAPITFDVSYSLPTGGTTYHVHQGDNLQAAIDNAILGDVIVLDAGAVFTGNFKLPNKTGSGWIYIISSDLASLPVENNRVAPSDAAHMPKIITPNSDPALSANVSAHNFRFVGIEFSVDVNNYNLIHFGAESSVDQLPYNITFDRCYLHSTSDSHYARVGITADGRYIAVINSYLFNFKDTSDAQAILVWNGCGPYKIVNNYLEATGENFLSGGQDPSIPNLVPSDIEFRGNYCYKPLYWKSDDPSYNGYHWGIKNIFELKNAQRVLATGNIFENDWADGQDGTAILFTVRNQSGTAEWCTVRDVTFANNIVKHVGAGFNMTGMDYPNTSQQTQRIYIHNNLVLDMEYALGGSRAMIGGTTAGQSPLLDLVITNNLCMHGPSVDSQGNSFLTLGGSADAILNMTYENNIVTFADYGVAGTGTSSGTASLDYYVDNYSFQGNVIIMRPADRTYAYYLANFGTKYPAGNYAADDVFSVGFTNYAQGNYRLDASSPYKNVGTDGKNPGPDFDALEAATGSTISGSLPGVTVALSTTSPLTNDVLIATATKAESHDNPVTLTYIWQVNGVVKRTFTSATALSDSFNLGIPGNGDSGDVITVQVTPNDGTQDGVTVSDTATVAGANVIGRYVFYNPLS